MKNSRLLDVHFQHYWTLLQRIAPWIDVAMIFGESGMLCWLSVDSQHPQMDRICFLVKTFKVNVDLHGITAAQEDLADNQKLYLTHISNPGIDMSLITVHLVQGHSQDLQLQADDGNTVYQLDKALLTDYYLLKTDREKEQELNELSEELISRYEELNLIYSSEGKVQHLCHGRESLQQIVTNALKFLDISLVAIILPEQNITLHHFRYELGGNKLDYQLSLLKLNVYEWLQKNNQTLVINHQKNATNAGIFIDCPFKMIASPILNADNQVMGLIATINASGAIDFTNSDRRLIEVLANRASDIIMQYFDPLTGLENTHSFEMAVLESLKQTWKTDCQHAIAYIDIDYMAIINSVSGMKAGNALIKEIGGLLCDIAHEGDTVAHLGTDKFALLMHNTDLQKAHNFMQHVSTTVSKIELNWEGKIHEGSVSIGIAPITSDIQNVSTILSHVESALAIAKEQGRSQVYAHYLDSDEEVRREKMICSVSETQNALRQDLFLLYAQRIMPIGSANIVEEYPHFEILVRMVSNKNGLVLPGDFLPAAEHFYLMPKLDSWVIRNTFKQLNEMHKKYGKAVCAVSINLSGQSLTSDVIEFEIKAGLNEFSIDPCTICFEVTETAAMTNMKKAQSFIQNIRKLGCHFSLDDFGTGLSSFAYLKDLKVDYLKIDGIFVKDIVTDKVSYSMVSAIHQVGSAMGLKTIAEYVENNEIVECLETIGIDYAQGYGINKPRLFSLQIDQLLGQSD